MIEAQWKYPEIGDEITFTDTTGTYTGLVRIMSGDYEPHFPVVEISPGDYRVISLYNIHGAPFRTREEMEAVYPPRYMRDIDGNIVLKSKGASV